MPPPLDTPRPSLPFAACVLNHERSHYIQGYFELFLFLRYFQSKRQSSDCPLPGHLAVWSRLLSDRSAAVSGDAEWLILFLGMIFPSVNAAVALSAFKKGGLMTNLATQDLLD